MGFGLYLTGYVESPKTSEPKRDIFIYAKKTTSDGRAESSCSKQTS